MAANNAISESQYEDPGVRLITGGTMCSEKEDPRVISHERSSCLQGNMSLGEPVPL